MKTQTFETSKGTLYVVDMPEGVKDRKIVITKAGYPDIELIALGGTHPEYIGLLPPGDWKEIGLWGSVSEEKAKEVVEEHEMSGIGGTFYRVYDEDEKGEFLMTSIAVGSLQSLLETEINISNPLGKKPIRSIPFMGDGYYTQNDLDAIDLYQDYLKKWQAAESLVWKNPFLIFKTK